MFTLDRPRYDQKLETQVPLKWPTGRVGTRLAGDIDTLRSDRLAGAGRRSVLIKRPRKIFGGSGNMWHFHIKCAATRPSGRFTSPAKLPDSGNRAVLTLCVCVVYSVYWTTVHTMGAVTMAGAPTAVTATPNIPHLHTSSRRCTYSPTCLFKSQDTPHYTQNLSVQITYLTTCVLTLTSTLSTLNITNMCSARVIRVFAA